jgi:hypothetical protein
LPADQVVPVPPTTFTDTDALGTAPTITIPASGTSSTFYDGGPFGVGIIGEDRIYSFTLSDVTNFTLGLDWSNAADVDILVRDGANTASQCSLSGTTGAQPESATCTGLPAGPYFLVINLSSGPVPGVIEVVLTTP